MCIFTYVDDLAIVAAINEIEDELKEEGRRSIFDTDTIMDVDMNEIDANLKQVQPDSAQQAKNDAISAEGTVKL